MSKVAVIAYNAGNTLSVVAALQRLGAETLITDSVEEISKADRIIFPGVGHATPAAAYLKKLSLDKVLISAKQPVLGICLGMQLMCKYTEEGDTEGMGHFDTVCREFKVQEKVPHMGWNNIERMKGRLFKDIPQSPYVYFVHSFRVDCCAETAAECHYGIPFSAALEKDNFFGVQFHPEKSGALGQQIIDNFLKV